MHATDVTSADQDLLAHLCHLNMVGTVCYSGNKYFEISPKNDKFLYP
jgi:hypothetical protein